MLSSKQVAESGTFSVKQVGSEIYGTNISEESDLDLMGICFQPPGYLLGLQHFEQYVFRSAESKARFNPEDDQRKSGQQPRSRSGDVDLVIYSVQKFLKLALAGNPSILVFFFSQARQPQYEIDSFSSKVFPWGWAVSFDEEIENIASVQAGPKFLGYLKAQKERLLGRRGQMRVTRRELIDAYGYDVKYAFEALRLGLQGIEFMQRGKISLPVPAAESLKAVRRGEYLLSEVVDWIERLEEDLKEATNSSPLPKHPDYNSVDRWLVDSQLEFFEWLKENQHRKESLSKLP
jgi:hypothetical protein